MPRPINCNPLCICAHVTADYKIAWISQTTAPLTREDAIGSSVLSYFEGDEHRRVREAMERAIGGEEVELESACELGGVWHNYRQQLFPLRTSITLPDGSLVEGAFFSLTYEIPMGVRDLTTVQRRLLESYAHHKSQKLAARACEVNPNTARTHFQRIRAKLSAEDHEEVLAVGLRLI